MRAKLSILVSLTLLGCQNLLSVPPVPGGPRSDAGSQNDGSAKLSFEPEADAGSVARVLRIRVRLPGGALEDPSTVWLFSGELSSYYLGRIHRNDLPRTLLGRKVPALVWEDLSASALVVAPSVPLAAGQLYSLASPDSGLIGVVRVRKSPGVPLLARVWPPREAGTGARRAVFCRDASAPTVGGRAELEPAAIEARVLVGANEAGAARGTCLTLTPLQSLPDGAIAVAPPRFAGVALDPAPLRAGPAAPRAVALDCTASDVQIGPGCARVLDDRLVLRTPASPLLWVVSHDHAVTLQAEDGSKALVVRGFQPSSVAHLIASVTDLSGTERDFPVVVRTEPALPHIVINEVMANPLGPEPAQEWVELVNDGTQAVQLQGFTLSDGAGTTELGEVALDPDQFALVVRNDFSPDDGIDPRPAQGTTLIRVAEIGKNGLSNAGEALTLYDPGGHVVSRFAAVRASKGGVSISRRYPWSLDDAPDAFGPSADGASPGAPNAL